MPHGLTLCVVSGSAAGEVDGSRGALRPEVFHQERRVRVSSFFVGRFCLCRVTIPALRNKRCLDLCCPL